MAKLYFRYGAMGSSKSANILMVRYNYEERGQYAVLLKPRTDNRDGEHEIKSRIGLEAPAEYVDEFLAEIAKTWSKAGEDLQPTIDKMNALIQDYAKKSSPKFCAKAGLTDEIVDMNDIRPYIQAFANACYQNPESICPVHQMLLPRVIRDYDALNAQ